MGYPTAVLAVALALICLGPVRAAADEPRSVAVLAEGPGADAVAASLASRLSGSFAVRGAHDVRVALGSAQAPIANGLKSRRAGEDLVARARAAAKEAHVDVAILLHVRKARRASVVHVWVVPSSQGRGSSVDEELTLGGGASSDDETDAAWRVVKDALPAEAPPPATTASPDTAPPPPEAAAAPIQSVPRDQAPEPAGDTQQQPASGEGEKSLLRVSVASAAGSRHFAYVDRLTSSLRPYDLFAAPLASVRIEALPFVRSSNPVLRGLGLDGEYARAFGVSSADASGTPVSTTWQAFHADIRDVVALGAGVHSGAHVGFGANDFSFEGALGPGAVLPSVGYRFVRAGLDGQLDLHGLSVYAEASYLAVLSTGAFGSLFPRGSVGGIDARAGIVFLAGRHLDVSFELAYERFFYSLHPVPGDTNVAGGALDEMALASLGVGYRL
jgi:hypothetical protein